MSGAGDSGAASDPNVRPGAKPSSGAARAVSAPVALLERTLARLGDRLGAGPLEMASLVAILLAAAALRFVDLPARGGWDSDQATSMFDLTRAVSTGQLPALGPLSSLMTFHHGALYYDLLLPAAWLGNGDPTWIVAEIALLSLLVVPIAWWIARTIGGPAAGLTAALLAAISASLISYATFIWNPTLVEPGAAVAFLGAWQALRTHRARWWTVAAAGAAVAAQSHVAAGFIVLPIGVAFLFDLWRGPSSRRPRIAAWGLAGVALFVATYLPLLVYELGHDFTETRGIVAYFTNPSSTTSTALPLRFLLAGIRILAWPLTRWPIVDFKAAFPQAFLVASAIFLGLLWRLGATAPQRGSARAGLGPTVAPAEGAAPGRPAKVDGRSNTPANPRPVPSAEDERFGVQVIGGWLLLIIVVLGIGLHSVSEVQELPTEQYHVIADPLVIVAAGLIVGGLWRVVHASWLTVARRLAAVAVLGALLAWNAGHWPPLVSPDGGWPAAQAAAARLERDTGGSSLALVPLFEPKGIDAYYYPLWRDGFRLSPPEGATTVALLCDTFWMRDCEGAAEEGWLATNRAGRGLTLIDRYAAAPDRILSVYRREP